MSFQNQHGSIANELRKLGMSVDAATRLASILGNPNQPTRTGPQTQDLTPEALQYVTSQTRKLQLSNLDFREGDLISGDRGRLIIRGSPPQPSELCSYICSSTSHQL